MTAYAAIDCGSNSTRLLAVDSTGTVIARELTVTRLAQGVDASGSLDPSAIDRTVAALRNYRAVLDTFEPVEIRVFATSAVRDSDNAKAFMTAAAGAIGVMPQVLSGEEEGLVTFAGAVVGLPQAPYLVIDIGGGSTELVWGSGSQTHACSMDIGCVRLTERILHSDPYSANELSRSAAACKEWLLRAEVELPDEAADAQLVGVAGTITTVAAMDLGIDFDADRIHHHRLSRSRVEELFSIASAQSRAQRVAEPSIPDDRADVIVAGLSILLTTMRHFHMDDCLVSISDNLDGTLAAMRNL